MTINCLELFTVIPMLYCCKKISAGCTPGQQIHCYVSIQINLVQKSIRNKSKQHCHHNYKINYKDLESKSEIEDLGFIVDKNLRFSNRIIDKVNKANQTMAIIRRTMVHLNKHNFNLLCKSLAKLHLEYGNVV